MADELALIEQAYADFARGDVPAVLAVLADDVEWSEAEGHPYWCTVLMQGRYSGTGKATGKTLDAQAAHVWDVRDGKVVRFQQYSDTAKWRDLLGVTA